MRVCSLLLVYDDGDEIAESLRLVSAEGLKVVKGNSGAIDVGSSELAKHLGLKHRRFLTGGVVDNVSHGAVVLAQGRFFLVDGGLDVGFGVAASLHVIGSEELQHLGGELGGTHLLGVRKRSLGIDCGVRLGLNDEFKGNCFAEEMLEEISLLFASCFP